MFGVYCPEVGKCYLVPVEDVTRTTCSLRVDPPKNGQKKGIRWAANYEVRPQTRQLQEGELP